MADNIPLTQKDYAELIKDPNSWVSKIESLNAAMTFVIKEEERFHVAAAIQHENMQKAEKEAETKEMLFERERTYYAQQQPSPSEPSEFVSIFDEISLETNTVKVNYSDATFAAAIEETKEELNQYQTALKEKMGVISLSNGQEINLDKLEMKPLTRTSADIIAQNPVLNEIVTKQPEEVAAITSYIVLAQTGFLNIFKITQELHEKNLINLDVLTAGERKQLYKDIDRALNKAQQNLIEEATQLFSKSLEAANNLVAKQDKDYQPVNQNNAAANFKEGLTKSLNPGKTTDETEHRSRFHFKPPIANKNQS